MLTDDYQDQTPEHIVVLNDQEIETRARQHFNKLRAADGRALHAARTAGRYLREHKRRMSHGGWLPWLRDNYPGSEDLAEEAMRIAEHWDVIAVWMEQNDALTKTAALRRLREHLRPKPDSNQLPPCGDPLAACGDLKGAARRHRDALGHDVRAQVRQMHAQTAFVIGALPELRQELLDRIRVAEAELGSVGELVARVLERVRRCMRGEPEFQIECDTMNPRPVPCPDCRTGSCQCHTAESYDEVIRTTAEPIEGARTPLQGLAISALIRNHANRLRPAERELLDHLLADQSDALAGTDEQIPDEQPPDGFPL